MEKGWTSQQVVQRHFVTQVEKKKKRSLDTSLHKNPREIKDINGRNRTSQLLEGNTLQDHGKKGFLKHDIKLTNHKKRLQGYWSVVRLNLFVNFCITGETTKFKNQPLKGRR